MGSTLQFVGGFFFFFGGLLARERHKKEQKGWVTFPLFFLFNNFVKEEGDYCICGGKG